MKPEAETFQYLIPSRMICGSAEDVLEQLDDVIQALVLARAALAATLPPGARTRRRRWRDRVRAAFSPRGQPEPSTRR